MKQKRILLLRIDRLGDFILSIPVITRLKTIFPNAKIDLITNPLNVPIAEKINIFHSILPFKSQSLINHTNMHCILNLLTTQYDTAIDLIPGTNTISSILLFLSRAKEKAGYAVGLRKFLITTKVIPHKLKYETQLVLDILKKIHQNIIPIDLKKEYSILKKVIDKEYQKRISQLNSFSSQKILLIHPGLGEKDQRRYWPPEYYAQLIKKIKKFQPNIHIIMTGQQEDTLIFKKISTLAKDIKIINFIGKTTLIELISLIDLAHLIICPLTGVTHIAAALQKKVITIHGPTPIKRWTSPELNYVIVSKNLPCSPCEHLPTCIYKGTRKNVACMTSLTPELVFQKLKPLLSKTL